MKSLPLTMASLPIFTVVSRPGPAERRVLDSLPAVCDDKRRVGGGVALRTIESRPPPGHVRPAMVLLHGRGHCAAVWAPFLRAFAPERRVMAIDLPGFGHSGSPDASPRTAEEGLDFFAAPIADLVAQEREAVLVGHSLGALIALELTLRKSVAVRGLVLVGAMGLGPYVSPMARAYLRAGPERIAQVTRWFGGGRTKNGVAPDLAALRAELHLVRGGRRHAKSAFDAMLPLVGDAFHRQERLGEVSAPTLLLWGAHDEAFPLPVAMAARARLPGAELEVIDAGHSPHLEAPDRCVAITRAFLERAVDSICP